MIVQCKAAGKQLKVNGNTITFIYDIRKALVYKNMVVVLLNVPVEDEETIDNLYAVNESGEILWRVQSLRDYLPNSAYLPYEEFSVEQDQIVVWDLWSRSFYISPENGKIQNMRVSGW